MSLRERLVLPVSPSIKSLLSIGKRRLASLGQHGPGSRAHNFLDTSFLPHQVCQLLCPWLAWEVTRGIRVQSLVDDSITILLRLGRPQCDLRVVRVRACGNQRTVCEDIRPGLPGWKEHFVLEFLTGHGTDMLPWMVWCPCRGRSGIKSSLGGCHESIETLRDGVVHRAPRQSQEISQGDR